MPARILSRVDLPVPLPPTRPVRSSGVMSQLASSKRSFWPKRLPAEESWSIPLLFSHWLRGLTPIYTDDTDSKGASNAWKADMGGGTTDFAMLGRGIIGY